MTEFKYNHTDLHLRYGTARRLPEETMRLMNEKRLPSKEAVIHTMKAHKFELTFHDMVRQKFADTLREYCETISQRALSDLASISDTDFHVGLQRMAEVAQQEGHPKVVYEPIDLFVFRRS